MFTSLKTYGGAIREIFLDKGLKEAIKAGGEVFTSSASSFFTSFAGSATLGIATAFAMTKALEALSDAYNLSYDSAMKNTQANVDSFNTTKTEIKNLESEAQQYKDTLSSLSDKYEVDLSGIESIDEMITKLRQSGKLELTDETELAKIDSQNAALERQLSIKEKLLLSQQKQAAADARDALGRGEQSVAQQVAQFVPGGKKRYQGQVNNVGVVEAVNENVLAIQEYENAIEKAEKAMKDLDPDSKAWKEQEENINSYNEAIEKLKEDLNTKETDLTTLLSAFSVDGEGLVALDGFEKEFEAVKDAIENLNNINLSPAEQKLAKIESFFDGSAGKNFIKDELLEATEQGKKASVVLREMGYDLESAGLDALTLNKYFEDMAANAKDAADSVYDYTASVSDVSNALESENKDKDWSSISDARKEINELLKEGKTGTDDVEMFAKFVNPERVKKLAEKGGKYIADAYEEAIKEVAPIMNRWFGEDETKSMENFVDDFENKGLWDVKTDSKGLWDITTQFESTYEAAEKFGVGVEVIETALRGLEAYGYVFDDVLFSGDAISEYQTNLNQIKSIYDNLEDSELKSRLKDIIDQSEVDDFENNIDKITEDKIIKISFEADLASIQAEINNYLALIEGGANTVENNAQVIAGNERYISKAEEGVGFDSEGFVIPVEYKTNEASLEKLKDELRITKDENKKLEIQAEIQNIQNVQKDLLLAFSDANPTINAESTTTEIQKAWDSFIVSAEAQEILAKVNFEGADTPQEVLVNAKMNNAEEVRKQISEMGRNTSIIFDADVNGAVTEVEAVKDVFGNIRYWADVNGVKSQLKAIENQDGTVTYIPITEAVDKHDYDQDGIVDYKGIFPTSAPNLKATVKYSYSYAHDGTLPSENLNKPRASGTFLSPAHKDGTAYNVFNTLPLSAYAGGRVGLPRNERALVNEEYINGHSESIVRDGVWRLIPGGAHLENLKQGDLIFSAKQTDDLLRSGRTPGHARAFAQGNVLAPAYRLGDPSKRSKKSTKSKTPKRDIVDITDKTTKQLEKSLKKIDTYFDWIEILFERLAQNSENAKDKIERAGKLSGKYGKLAKTNEAIETVQKERKGVQAGRDEYKKKAKSVARQVGLDKYLQKRVQDGTIKISEYGENTQNKINAYKEWWDKYEEANNKLLDLKDEEVELALSRFDLIQEWYDAEQDIHDSMIERNQSKLDLREAKGYSATSKGAEKLLRSNLNQAKYKKADAVSERNKYQAEIKRQLKNGTLKEGTLDYKEAKAELNRLNAAVNEASIEVINHADALREIKYEKLNNAIAKFERAAEKIQNKIDLAEARDKNVSETTYRNQISQNNKTIDKKYALRNEKLEEQSKYAVNSKRYQELADEISGYENEIYGLLTENENIKDNIFESRFAPLEEGVEALQNVRSELDDFRSLFNEEAFFDSKTGALTGEGVANIYLIEEAMISAKQEIANHSEGLDKLEENYKNGVISQEEFNEKSEEYRRGIRNATSNVKEYSDALSDLYITQMEKENELLQEVIDKRKEALQRKEEYYDYDKNIRSQTKDLNMLRAQAAALEGANDAASIARLKKLRQEIADAEEELNETKRQHSVEMQEKGYDSLLTDLDDILADTELEIKTNADKQLQIIDSMLQQTVNKYAEAYGKINEIIASTGFVGSSDFNTATDNISTQDKAGEQLNKALTSQSSVQADSSVSNIKTSDIDTDTSNNHAAIEKALNDPEKTTNRKVAQVTLSKSKLSLKEGESKKVTATVLPGDAKNRKLKWESSNKKVATVSGGTIKAKKAGTCTITATATDGSGKKDSLTVTVAKKTTSNSKDGKITKGEKVTYSSGKYTAKSDGSGKKGSDKLGKSVYISSIKSGAKRPYQISSDKAGKNILGWVTKSQLKGYASGSKYISEDQFAWTQENGGSELITLPDGSVLTKLPKGSGVIPHNLTENLWGLANSAEDIMANTVGNTMKYINNVVNNGGNTINYHYDSLLTVNGDVDRAVLPELKEILKQSYQYTTQQMTKDALRAGNKIRR